MDFGSRKKKDKRLNHTPNDVIAVNFLKIYTDQYNEQGPDCSKPGIREVQFPFLTESESLKPEAHKMVKSNPL